MIIPIKKCERCNGTGGMTMGGELISRCRYCCKHEKGWILLDESFGANAGKLKCAEWCGYMKTGRVPLVDKKQ